MELPQAELILETLNAHIEMDYAGLYENEVLSLIMNADK